MSTLDQRYFQLNMTPIDLTDDCHLSLRIWHLSQQESILRHISIYLDTHEICSIHYTCSNRAPRFLRSRQKDRAFIRLRRQAKELRYWGPYPCGSPRNHCRDDIRLKWPSPTRDAHTCCRSFTSGGLSRLGFEHKRGTRSNRLLTRRG